jgi:hypothetical protein
VRDPQKCCERTVRDFQSVVTKCHEKGVWEFHKSVMGFMRGPQKDHEKVTKVLQQNLVKREHGKVAKVS